jgi:hypothetical protein
MKFVSDSLCAIKYASDRYRNICQNRGSHRLEQSPRRNSALLLVSNKHACKEPLGSESELTEGAELEAQIMCSRPRPLRGSTARVFKFPEELSNERSSAACGSTTEERGLAIDEKS